MASYSDRSALSVVLNELWRADTNRLTPCTDYSICLQAEASPREHTDEAPRRLFHFVDENKLKGMKTYSYGLVHLNKLVKSLSDLTSFMAMLNNYESGVGTPECLSAEELKEIDDFLDAVMETQVLKIAHKYLVSKGCSSPDTDAFKKQLFQIWFELYSRSDKTEPDSCGFEHVFVGETRHRDVIGFHNWLQFYLQEQRGAVDYHGYVSKRKRCAKPDEEDQLIAVQFTWKGLVKPIGGSFIGTSPEFELALYTICFLLCDGHSTTTPVDIDVYHCHVIMHRKGPHIATAYPVLLEINSEPFELGRAADDDVGVGGSGPGPGGPHDASLTLRREAGGDGDGGRGPSPDPGRCPGAGENAAEAGAGVRVEVLPPTPRGSCCSGCCPDGPPKNSSRPKVVGVAVGEEPGSCCCPTPSSTCRCSSCLHQHGGDAGGHGGGHAGGHGGGHAGEHRGCLPAVTACHGWPATPLDGPGVRGWPHRHHQQQQRHHHHERYRVGEFHGHGCLGHRHHQQSWHRHDECPTWNERSFLLPSHSMAAVAAPCCPAEADAAASAAAPARSSGDEAKPADHDQCPDSGVVSTICGSILPLAPNYLAHPTAGAGAADVTAAGAATATAPLDLYEALGLNKVVRGAQAPRPAPADVPPYKTASDDGGTLGRHNARATGYAGNRQMSAGAMPLQAPKAHPAHVGASRGLGVSGFHYARPAYFANAGRGGREGLAYGRRQSVGWCGAGVGHSQLGWSQGGWIGYRHGHLGSSLGLPQGSGLAHVGLGSGHTHVESGRAQLGSGHAYLGSGHGQLGSGHAYLGSGHGQLGSGHACLGSGHGHLGSAKPHVGSGHAHVGSDHSHVASGHAQLGSGHAQLGSGHAQLGSGHAYKESGHAHLKSGYTHVGSGHAHAGLDHAYKESGHPQLGSGHTHVGSAKTHVGSGHAQLGSGHNQFGSGHAHVGSGHAHVGSGHAHVGSGHAQLGSGHAYKESGHAQLGSGHAHIGSGHTHAGSGHAHVGSGHAHVGSGHAQLGSGHAYKESGHAQLGSGHAHIGSGHTHAGSGHAHVGLDHAHLASGHAHVNVDHAHIKSDHAYKALGKLAQLSYVRLGSGLVDLGSGHAHKVSGGSTEWGSGHAYTALSHAHTGLGHAQTGSGHAHVGSGHAHKGLSHAHKG